MVLRTPSARPVLDGQSATKAIRPEVNHEPHVGGIVFIGHNLDCKATGRLGCKDGSYAVDVVRSEVGLRSRLKGSTGLVLRPGLGRHRKWLTGVVRPLDRVPLGEDQRLPDEIIRWLSVQMRFWCGSSVLASLR